MEYEIFSVPPSPVEINNLPAIKTPAPLDIEWWPPYSENSVILLPRTCYDSDTLHTILLPVICARVLTVVIYMTPYTGDIITE